MRYMVKESSIRKKVIEELNRDGWIVTTFMRSRFGGTITYTPEGELLRGDDAFTIFDGIGWRGNKKIYIQWTSKANMSTRRKKIKEFKRKYDLNGKCHLWGYDKAKRKFKKEIV